MPAGLGEGGTAGFVSQVPKAPFGTGTSHGERV